MFAYENGVVIAFGLGVFSIFKYIYLLSSIENRNFKKIGHFYSPFSASWKPKKTHAGLHILYVSMCVTVTPLLSWVYICYFMFGIGYNARQRLVRPKALKDLYYDLEKKNLTKEQVFETMLKIYKYHGLTHLQAVVTIEKGSLGEDEESSAFIETRRDDGWSWSMALDKDRKLVEFKTSGPGFDCTSMTLCEYRNQNTSLEWRTVFMSEGGLHGQDNVRIADNVIQYEALTTNEKKKDELSETRSEEIADLTEKVNWMAVPKSDTFYYILANGCDLPNSEVRHFFQEEIQRIERGFYDFSKDVQKYGGVVEKNDRGYTATRNSLSPDGEQDFKNLFEDSSLRAREITLNEFINKDEIVESLRKKLLKLPQMAA